MKLPDIPPDVARNNNIQDLLDLYQNLIDEFKDVHKRTRMLQKENASEIINDIKEMAVERDIGTCNKYNNDRLSVFEKYMYTSSNTFTLFVNV